jgi:hypothetical protein
MADVTSTPPIKTVPKPRDTHLRDMADCIRFLSMDAVQQATGLNRSRGSSARRATEPTR